MWEGLGASLRNAAALLSDVPTHHASAQSLRVSFVSISLTPQGIRELSARETICDVSQVMCQLSLMPLLTRSCLPAQRTSIRHVP